MIWIYAAPGLRDSGWFRDLRRDGKIEDSRVLLREVRAEDAGLDLEDVCTAWVETGDQAFRLRVFKWQADGTSPAVRGQIFKTQILAFAAGDEAISRYIESERDLLATGRS